MQPSGPKVHLQSGGSIAPPAPGAPEATGDSAPIRRTGYRHQRFPGRTAGGNAEPKGKRALFRPRPSWIAWFLLAIVGVGVIAFVYGWVEWGQIPRAARLGDLPGPAAGAPDNILMVGSDTRQDLTDANDFGGKSVAGQRADSIMLMSVPPSGKISMISVPRDLRLDIPGRGVGKINGAFNGGAPLMVQAVESATGLTVNHYVQINFDGFKDLATAVGGVEMCVDHDARDAFSGLALKAGCTNLVGDQALAWVRSRHTEFLVNGQWKPDPRGDLGRIDRQQQFMKKLFAKMATPTAVLHFPQLVGAAKKAFAIDPSFSYFGGIGLGMGLVSTGSGSIQFMTLPITPKTIGGVAYVVLKQPDATKLLSTVKSGGVPQPPPNQNVQSIPDANGN